MSCSGVCKKSSANRERIFAPRSRSYSIKNDSGCLMSLADLINQERDGAET